MAKFNIRNYKYFNQLFSKIIFSLSTIIISNANLAALACTNYDHRRLAGKRSEYKRTIQTSNGKNLACWWDKNAKPIIHKSYTYAIVIRCAPDFILYTNYDSINQVVFKINGNRSTYKAKFLGEVENCDSKGRLTTKRWIYRKGDESITQTDYVFSPFK